MCALISNGNIENALPAVQSEQQKELQKNSFARWKKKESWMFETQPEPLSNLTDSCAACVITTSPTSSYDSSVEAVIACL